MSNELPADPFSEELMRQAAMAQQAELNEHTLRIHRQMAENNELALEKVRCEVRHYEEMCVSRIRRKAARAELEQRIARAVPLVSAALAAFLVGKVVRK